MKPKSAPRSSRSKSRDSKQDNDAKTTQEKHQKRTSSSTKPLNGKVFYLDLPSNKRSERLENDIQTLGGTVEKFFSKDIRYLVSNKPEARYVHRLVRDSPVPSPESALSSPHPSSNKEGQRSSSQGPTDAVQVSRGKSLVEKVVKEQERIQMNKMFSNALEWGVKVLHIEDIMAYVEKKKPVISLLQKTKPPAVKKNVKPTCYERTTFQKHSASRIRKPFVKVEDSSRCYRPLYLHMAQMPVCNFTSAPPASPFQIEEKRRSTHGPKGHTVKSKHRGHLGREKRKGGYCECCGVKYDMLKAHLKGEQHQAFVAGNNYQELDALVAQLPWVFAQEPPRQSHKCSMPTSPIAVSVLRGTPEEAGERGNGCGRQEQQSESPSLGMSFSSLRKRGRDPLSGVNRGPSEEVPDVPEYSRSKQTSYEWDSCSTLRRALDNSPVLLPNEVPDSAVVETTSGAQRTESRRQRRPYKGKRSALLSYPMTDQKRTDTFGSIPVPSEETVTLSQLEQDPPVETIQDKTVHATLQDLIQEKPVDITQGDSVQEKSLHMTQVDLVQEKLSDITQVDSVQEKPVDTTQQESIHVKTIDGTRQDTIQVKLVDTTQWDLVQEKPVDTTQKELIHGQPVDITWQDSTQGKPVDTTLQGLIQCKPTDVTQQDSLQEKPVALQPVRTFKPVVSNCQQWQPVQTKKRSVESRDQEPVQTPNATDIPNPTPNTLEDTADCQTAGGTFSPLRRRVRPERSWRRGGSLSARSLSPGPLHFQSVQNLWQLFDDSDEMLDDHLAFGD